MKPLILVKHSLPEIVKNVPAREWNLSDVGREHARKLAEALIPYQPDMIVSSDEPKATQTAELVAQELNLPFQIVDGLHEHDRSNLLYLPRERFQQLVRRFFEQPDELILGKETATQALERFRQAVDSVLKSLENKNIVIVTHGTVISLYTAWLTECDGYELWCALDLPSYVTLDLQSRKLLETINIP